MYKNLEQLHSAHLVPVRQEALEDRLSSAASGEDIQRTFDLIIPSFGLNCGLLVQTSDTRPLLTGSVIDVGLSPAYSKMVEKYSQLFRRWVGSMVPNGVPVKWSLGQPGCPAPLVNILNSHGVSSGIVYPDQRQQCHVWLGGGGPPLARTDFNELCVILSHVTRRLVDFGFPPAFNSVLTPREIEALRWISEGKTSLEAAVIIGLSGHTITAYVNNAMRKLDCVSRAQLVAKAVRLNLIE